MNEKDILLFFDGLLDDETEMKILRLIDKFDNEEDIVEMLLIKDEIND